ncbi:hypothetical protein KDM87_14525 [Undibacterium sp. FT147W]|uniref:XRE family transcriptional regulator n=1 Tax=Undibacterium rivi TaxID=2828729 RepID=A0ABS5H5K0_9BURK|nr:hypothetical protein [Undibacterium rivi]
MKPVNTEQAKRNNAFIDLLIQTMELKNDAALSRVLEVAPPVISKIRHGRLPVGASMLISAHEESGLSIREMKDVLGLNNVAEEV